MTKTYHILPHHLRQSWKRIISTSCIKLSQQADSFSMSFSDSFPFSVVFAEATASSFWKAELSPGDLQTPEVSLSSEKMDSFLQKCRDMYRKRVQKKELWKSFEDGEHIHSSYAHGIEKLCWWLKNVLFRSDFMKSSQQTPPSGKPREAHLAAMQKPAGRS